MVKVSFVVAIYNVSKYLGRCIESLTGQTMQEIEIILVNDGSSDNCLEICNSYAARDDRITVIDQKNQGAGAARNSGLHAARGRWIYFVDGDDYVAPDICVNLVKYMEADYDVIFFTNAVCTGSGIRQIPHSGKTFSFDCSDFAELQLATLNRLGRYKYEMDVVEPACIWNKTYKREFLIENGLKFVTDFPRLEDIYFNLQVYDKAQKGIYVPIVGYYYQINDKSVTHRYQERVIEEFEVVNRRLAEFVSERKSAKLEKAYDERVATHIRTCVVLYLCNKRNVNPYRQRKQEFKQLREREPYRSAVKNTDIWDYRGYKEKILAFAVKIKWFGMCELLCRLNDLRIRAVKEAS